MVYIWISALAQALAVYNARVYKSKKRSRASTCTHLYTGAHVLAPGAKRWWLEWGGQV